MILALLVLPLAIGMTMVAYGLGRGDRLLAGSGAIVLVLALIPIVLIVSQEWTHE